MSQTVAWILIAFLLLSSCRAQEAKSEDMQVVRLVTGLGRVINPLAEALTRVLPNHFAARVEVQKTDGSVPSLRMLEDGDTELAVIAADQAYMAYNKGTENLPRPHRRIRGVAVLNASTLHLIATESSHIRSLLDLRGKRVAVSALGTPRMTIEAVGLALSELHAEQVSDEVAIREMRAGQLDAVFRTGNYPSPNVQEFLKIPGVRFVSILHDEVQKIRTHHPFLHSISIPAGVYGDNAEVETVGVDTLLVCREDLPEELVYWITRTLFESLPAMARSLGALRQVDLEQIHASPIPLHPGAARFYRERELFQ